MLHVSQNTDPIGGRMTKAAKVHNLVSYIGDKCLEHFLPLRDIAIDESTKGFKVRVSFKTYNPQKPTKWGLRVYILADSSTSYICVFQPYYGKYTTAALVRLAVLVGSASYFKICSPLMRETSAKVQRQWISLTGSILDSPSTGIAEHEYSFDRHCSAQ